MCKENAITETCLKRIALLIQTKEALTEKLLSAGYLEGEAKELAALEQAYLELNKGFLGAIIQEIKVLEASQQ